MGQFVNFIDIKVEHGYYVSIPSNFRLLPTPKTIELMRCRGMLLRQTVYGCQWLVQKDCAGFLEGDELELSLQSLDADFALVTQLPGYTPQSSYRLVLNSGKQVIDIAAAMMPQEERKTQSEFCRLSIRLTNEMLKLMREGTSEEYVLQFRVAAYHWEYLFVMRNQNLGVSQHLVLEEVRNRIVFDEMQRMENSPFGEVVWRTVSTKPIDCKEHPDYLLELSEILPGSLTKKRPVSRFIPCPRPGTYWSDEWDYIRQICYI